MFPEGEFAIRNRATGAVFDVMYESTEADTEIKTWEAKGEDSNANQRFRFEGGLLINLNSGLSVTFNHTGQGAMPTQVPGENADTQIFEYDDGVLSLAQDENKELVVGQIDDLIQLVPADGDDESQRWDLVEF
ncbi:hypothetical protein NLG97_g1662 [Lecanicillium saksenae]|uniref:Uncharacterized protein n=1 Tax=Lecanicillium saksenae TaxID=468837 RepID=A0ACC1R6J9_9HYPO|nr:hypothetical protein NLG97_g1662 [Lecanicillium saksenae]